MLRVSSFAAGVFVAMSAFAAQDARAANVVINSEQRAAAATVAAKYLGEEVPIYLAALTYPAKNYTERTLRVLEETYSAPALRRANKWVVVGCPGSGTFKARLPRNSHVLEIEWVACTFEISGHEYILTGPAQVTLCDDDLTPANVSALSVGDSRRDMVEQVATGGVLIDPQSQTSRNVRMAGLITLGRPTVDDNFDGNFAYSLEGYTHFVSRIRVAVPGEVYQTYESRTSAQNAWVSGILEHGDLGWQEDMRFSTGTLTSFSKRGAVLDQPETLDSHSIRTSGLRIRNSGDYMVDAEYFLIGGSVNYTFPQNRGMDCSNGGYTFKTNVLVRKPSGFQPSSYDAGEILINGAALVKFSANADPSELGEMHIDLDVANVGSFDYDGNGFYETALPAAARCVN